jgi:hypothetical protein
MRWYCVPCFAASRLKNSMLRFDSAIVTFTPSSRKASSSGEGRKSGMTFSSPSGSSVYLIFSVINSLAPSPVTSAKDSNDTLAVGKANREDAAPNLAKAVIPLLARAVRQVLSDHASRIGESELRYGEGNPMFRLVFSILDRIPVESGHEDMVSGSQPRSHIKVWL